jgi:DNA polymerase-3 subunit delta'
MQDLDDVLVPLGEVHEREMADFDQRSEEFGGLGKGERNRLEARHKREARRLRTEEIRSGLAAMLDGYRDRLDDDNGATFIAAAGLVQKLTESLTFNPNETLALRGLFTQLDSLQNPGG